MTHPLTLDALEADLLKILAKYNDLAREVGAAPMHLQGDGVTKHVARSWDVEQRSRQAADTDPTYSINISHMPGTLLISAHQVGIDPYEDESSPSLSAAVEISSEGLPCLIAHKSIGGDVHSLLTFRGSDQVDVETQAGPCAPAHSPAG